MRQDGRRSQPFEVDALQLRSVDQPHRSAGDLTETLIGKRDDGGLDHVGMRLECCLDLDRVHREAAPLDHVLLAPGEQDRVERSLACEVAGAQPAVAVEDVGGRIRRRSSSP